MKKDNALQIIKSRKLIPGVGKFTLAVASVTPFPRENGLLSFIVNFAAMTAWQIAESKKLFAAAMAEESAGNHEKAEELFQESTNIAVTASILEGKFVPQKGEIVDVEIDEMLNKDDIKILVVKAVIPRAVKTTTNVDFDPENLSATEVMTDVANVQEQAPLV